MYSPLDVTKQTMIDVIRIGIVAAICDSTRLSAP